MSLYDDAMNLKPIFKSNKEALDYYVKEYEALGAKYGKTGEEFWLEAENSPVYKEDYRKIMSIARHIMMARHLIKKENNG
jgi:hypothetical protein